MTAAKAARNSQDGEDGGAIPIPTGVIGAIREWKPSDDFPAETAAKIIAAISSSGASNPQDADMMLGLAADAAKQGSNTSVDTHMQKEEELAKDLEAVIQSGTLDSRHKLSQRMNMDLKLDPQKQADLKKLKGHDEKNKFRIAWAQQKLKDLKKEISQRKSFTKLDVEVGKYLPFSLIVKKEGGWKDKAAVIAAMKYVTKAIAMGGKWTEYNDMTERVDFFYVRKSKKEIFQKSWEEVVARDRNSKKRESEVGED